MNSSKYIILYLLYGWKISTLINCVLLNQISVYMYAALVFWIWTKWTLQSFQHYNTYNLINLLFLLQKLLQSDMFWLHIDSFTFYYILQLWQNQVTLHIFLSWILLFFVVRSFNILFCIIFYTLFLFSLQVSINITWHFLWKQISMKYITCN